MQMANAVALVTGANRGIGRAYVEALLESGARRIYAAARTPSTLDGIVALDWLRIRATWLHVISSNEA